MVQLRNLIIMVIAGISLNTSLSSDEGMWTIDNLPKKYLEEKYNFKMKDKWLKNAQLSSVRFNDGGSGAFVSSKGLVLTNHHVAIGQLQKMSKKNTDYVKNGFFTKSNQEEIKCPDLELNVLISMEDVTKHIQFLNAIDLPEPNEGKRLRCINQIIIRRKNL
jgi:hypothetical protein